MHRPSARRLLSTVAVAGLAVGLGPGVVAAHQVGGTRFDAPLPLPALFAGAGLTVALTALWLAVTERTPTPSGQRTVLTIPAGVATAVRAGASGLFLLAVAAVLVAGLTGRQVAAENVATVFTWPVWIHGLVLVAIAVGTPWRTLSPWRTLYRGLVRLERREIAVLGAYPRWLGTWPAVLGFVAVVGVAENLTVIPRSPRLTAAVVASYGLVVLLGSVLYGESWLRNADPLSVFYRLFGRVAPLSVDRGDDGWTLSVRSPWERCSDSVADLSVVVFVVATVYTVSFDGFTDTRSFQNLLFGLRDTLGLGPVTSVLLYGYGLVIFVATFLAAVWAVERLGAGGRGHWGRAARAFAPTVLPIAVAYEVAHSYPFVGRNAGRLVGLVVPGVGVLDPLAWLSVGLFWGSQVALVVLGHVVAVVAAHDAASKRYDSPAAARRGHLPLVVLMVGYTVLSLWIISQPVVA